MVEPHEIEVALCACTSSASGSAKLFVCYWAPLTAWAVVAHRRAGWPEQKPRNHDELEDRQRQANQEEHQAVEKRLRFVKALLSGNLPKGFVLCHALLYVDNPAVNF